MTRVSTWNILAPEYAVQRDGRDFYTHAHPWDEWPRRSPRLLEEIPALGADLLCLQEVSTAFWHAALAARLAAAGYAATFCDDRKVGVGVALAWRTVEFDALELLAPSEAQVRPGRGVGARLQRRSDGRTVAALSVHLSWSPDPEVRRDLLSRALMALEGAPAEAWLLAGDVNFDPHAHAAWAAWAAAGWATSHPDGALRTWAADGRSERLDALLVRGAGRFTAGLPVLACPALPGLPSAAVPSDHVPLSAVFEHTFQGQTKNGVSQ